MSGSNALQLVNEHGWRNGLANVLRKENERWWGRGRQWLSHGLIWLVLINGLFALNLWVVPVIRDSDWAQARMAAESANPMITNEEAAPAAVTFMMYMGVLPVFGAIIIAQSAIVGEKQSGTAEWIFSNPVSRPAFILAKLVAIAIGVFVTVIVLQGAVGYGQIGLSEGWLPILPYLGAMSWHSLHLLFYLTLTLMLGAFFNGRSPVLGIAFGVYVGQFFVGELLELFFLTELVQLLPARLPDQATQLVTGEPIASIGAITVTALCSIIFIVVAMWRFQREEF